MASRQAERERAKPSTQDGGASVPFAFTREQAASLSNVSQWQAREWAKTGLLRPSFNSGLYSFRDLVGLRTLGILRKERGVQLRTLKSFSKWLREKYEEPWSTKSFGTAGREVMLVDGVRLVSGDVPGQYANAECVIDLQRVKAAIREKAKDLTERDPDEVGRITRTRGVCHGQPRIAGTRITTKLIWDALQSGMSPKQVIEQYPRLEREDVAAAIQFEQTRAA